MRSVDPSPSLAYEVAIGAMSIGQQGDRIFSHTGILAIYRADCSLNLKRRSVVGFLNLIRRSGHERAGFELYGIAVAAAREPFLYTTIGVPDTFNGRFDMIALHVFLVIRRLAREPFPGPDLAQAVFDAMFSDMDMTLREMGVGDLSVGGKVRVMWEAFHGRAASYSKALQVGDFPALEAALTRNVWRGAPPHGDAAAMLRRVVEQVEHHLGKQELGNLSRGDVEFPILVYENL
jgi:cytochrome b pre-mRNA-processing protein 3